MHNVNLKFMVFVYLVIILMIVLLNGEMYRSSDKEGWDLAYYTTHWLSYYMLNVWISGCVCTFFYFFLIYIIQSKRISQMKQTSSHFIRMPTLGSSKKDYKVVKPKNVRR